MDDDRIRELTEVDPRHFWFRAKQKYLSLLIRTPAATILDVGCGGGGNMAPFIEQGCTVFGVDRSDAAVAACKAGGYTAFRADVETGELPELPAPVDYITAMDFLEHVAQPEEVLCKLRAVATPRTRLIATVPAWPWLFSDWDRAMGHVRRYRRREFCRILARGGWRVLRSTYVHAVPLMPAILSRKLLGPLVRKFRGRATPDGGRFYQPPRMLDSMLYHLYLPEILCFRLGLRLLLGLSVLAVAVPAQDGDAS